MSFQSSVCDEVHYSSGADIFWSTVWISPRHLSPLNPCRQFDTYDECSVSLLKSIIKHPWRHKYSSFPVSWNLSMYLWRWEGGSLVRYLAWGCVRVELRCCVGSLVPLKEKLTVSWVHSHWTQGQTHLEPFVSFVHPSMRTGVETINFTSTLITFSTSESRRPKRRPKDHTILQYTSFYESSQRC